MQNWEVIAVDDGSIDSSFSILQHYSQLDPRIRIYSIPQGSPGGEGFPCNQAMERAHGETVARVDADDWLQPEALSILYGEITRSGADVAVARYQLADETGCVRPDYGADSCWNYLRSLSHNNILEAPFGDVLLHLGPVACRNLYRRDFLCRHHIFYPEGNTRSQDHGFHWLCWSHAHKAVFVDAIVYNYRRGLKNQLTNTHVEQLIESYQRVMDWVADQLDQRGILADYAYLMELDMLRQVAGMARRLPLSDAHKLLRQWGEHVSKLFGAKTAQYQLHPHPKLRYWRWLRFCLRRARPWIGLVDSPVWRLVYQKLRPSDVRGETL